jgi:hypothetical protein
MRAVKLTRFFLPLSTLIWCPAVFSETATSGPADGAASSGERLTATCIRVKGSVQSAPLGAKSTDTQAWTPVVLGQSYGQGVQIRTGVRSSAVFKFGDDTVVIIDRSTLAAISEFYKSANAKRTRIGLDYGAVRAGVAEGGELRSDFAIDSPVATLSKRGTWDFEMWVERGTGRFDVRLADRGLVEVMHKLTGQVAQIHPSQFVNQAMMSWVETVKFNRAVILADNFSLTSEDKSVNVETNTGRTGLQPGGASVVTAGGTAVTGAEMAQTAAAQRQAQMLGTLIMREPLRLPRNAGEGDFGTGSGIGTGNTSVLRRSFMLIPAPLTKTRGPMDGRTRLR